MIMRKLIILLLILPFVTVGQKYVVSNGKYVKINGKYVRDAESTTPPYSYQAETLAWIALLSGTYTDDQKQAMDSLVIRLKNDTLWTIADRIFPFAFFNASDALIDMKASSDNATAVNSPTFTAKEGYKGNGSSSYINSNFIPATDGVNWTLNNASIGVYVNEASTGSNPYHMGGYTTGSNATSIAASTSGAESINSGFISLGAGDIVGLRLNNRISSSTIKVFWNNNTYTFASAANTLTPVPLYIFALRDGAGVGFYANSELSFVYIGGSLSSAQPAKLQSIIVWWKNKIATL